MLKITKGMLIEYALSLPPLVLVFDFNPQSLVRNRTINLGDNNTPGSRGSYGFTLPTETARASQGVTAQPETFSLEILLDASDRMNDGEAVATEFGIEPELATLHTMVEPKAQGPGGLQTLASLGMGGARAFQRSESASVLLLVWGTHILPVFMTSIRVTEEAHLPSLIPYRARATLNMQVIEGDNPFYQVEKVRQLVSAALNTGRTLVGGIF